MYIAPGLLDQRLGFYTRSDDGADGFVRPVYTKTGTWWGRLDVTSNTFTVAGAPQGHTDSRTTAVATVAEYVPVDPFGLVKIEGGSVLYFVRGVYQVRQMQATQLMLEEVDPTTYAEFVGYEGIAVEDGVHLVTTGGFSTGFDEGFN